MIRYILILLMCIGTAWADKEFGIGHPYDIATLPHSNLRARIEALPPQARANALKRLQAVSFPVADIAYIHVTPEGELFYVDPVHEYSSTAELESSPVIAHDTVFKLHSKATAISTIYLDFDGEDLSTNRYWNYIHSDRWVPVMMAQAYDVLDNGAEFSQREIEYIYAIWQRVSEDYAPFDVDVTTERPLAFGATVGHVLITKSKYIGEDGLEHCMYACYAGGVAWLNKWGEPFYQPALVYYDNLKTTSYIAEVSSHENGHNLGLTHDGSSAAAYYAGHGDGMIGWAPIMGNSYRKNVTQWSIGEYPNANNTQDDLAIIAGHLGHAADDYPDTIDGAVAITTGGFIHNEIDADWFFIDVVGDGWLDLTVTPSWADLDYTLHLNNRRGSNLDVGLAIVNPDGSVFVFDDLEDTQAVAQMSVGVGRYYIQVTGAGSTNYSKYNSQGEYVITGGVLAGNQLPVAVIAHVCPNNSINPEVVWMFNKNKSFAVRMDGGSSYDIDGRVTGYAWRDSVGTVISNAVTADVQLKGAGIRNYILVVTDEDGMQSESATHVIDVRDAPKGKVRKAYKDSQVWCD